MNNNNLNNNLPEKVEFTCKGCGKTIQVQENIYQQVYKDKELCLSCRGKENKAK